MFFQRISKSRCKFDSGLFQPILGLKMSPVMIWIVLGCCWVSQIRTKPGKNIWAPLLDSITSYYVQCPWKIVSFFRFFGTLITIFLYFPGVYWLVSDASRLAWTEAIPWASGHVAMAKYGSLGCRIRSKMRWRNKYSFQNFHVISTLNPFTVGPMLIQQSSPVVDSKVTKNIVY